MLLYGGEVSDHKKALDPSGSFLEVTQGLEFFRGEVGSVTWLAASIKQHESCPWRNPALCEKKTQKVL